MLEKLVKWHKHRSEHCNFTKKILVREFESVELRVWICWDLSRICPSSRTKLGLRSWCWKNSLNDISLELNIVISQKKKVDACFLTRKIGELTVCTLISAKGRAPRRGGRGPRATVPRPLAPPPKQRPKMPRNGQVHRDMSQEIVLVAAVLHQIMTILL